MAFCKERESENHQKPPKRDHSATVVNRNRSQRSSTKQRHLTTVTRERSRNGTQMFQSTSWPHSPAACRSCRARPPECFRFGRSERSRSGCRGGAQLDGAAPPAGWRYRTPRGWQASGPATKAAIYSEVTGIKNSSSQAGFFVAVFFNGRISIFPPEQTTSFDLQ